jgi:hypothetical protein
VFEEKSLVAFYRDSNDAHIEAGLDKRCLIKVWRSVSENGLEKDWSSAAKTSENGLGKSLELWSKCFREWAWQKSGAPEQMLQRMGLVKVWSSGANASKNGLGKSLEQRLHQRIGLIKVWSSTAKASENGLGKSLELWSKNFREWARKSLELWSKGFI